MRECPTRSRTPLTLSLTLALAVAAIGLAQAAPVAAQATKPLPPPTSKAKTEKANKREAAPQPEAPVDLNSATVEELTTLPGIGEATARKIIDLRPHRSVDDLAGQGIPARTLDAIKPLTVIRPIPPAVDLNNDALVRVETLPGVGPALAKEILAGRPYADHADLARVKGLGPAKIDSLRGRVKFGKAATEPAKIERREAARPETKREAAKPEAKATPKEAGRSGQKINLNTASLEELDALPGIGQVRAQAIVAGRPYGKIEDIMKLKGIKEVEFNKVNDSITVEK